MFYTKKIKRFRENLVVSDWFEIKEVTLLGWVKVISLAGFGYRSPLVGWVKEISLAVLV